MHEACVLREAETLIWCLAQDFVQATELIKAKIQNKHPIISLSPTIQYTVENRTNYLLCPVFHAMIMMINNSSADDNAVFLPEWFNPTDRDVICGWARQNHRHAGNQRFRRLVEHSAPLYVAARTKLEKTQVIASVVDKVRRDSPGGGFVKRDFHSGLWFEIGDDKARDKVGHAIRRAIEDGKKQSKNKSSEAKTKMKSTVADAASKLSSASGGLPSLDDFDGGEAQRVSKQLQTKSLDLDGKISSSQHHHTNPLMSMAAVPPQFQDKSDSLVVPSFLYQQAAALSNIQQQQDMSFANASSGQLNLQQMAGNMFGNPNMLDVLNQQQGLSAASFSAGGKSDIQDIFTNMNHLNAAAGGGGGGLSGKLSTTKAADDLSSKVDGMLSSSSFGSSMLNHQAFSLDQQMNSFGAPSGSVANAMRNNSQLPNLENFMQFGGGAGGGTPDLSFSLSNAGANQTAIGSSTGNAGAGEGLMGGLTTSGLGFLPSLNQTPAGTSSSSGPGRGEDAGQPNMFSALGRGGTGV